MKHKKIGTKEFVEVLRDRIGPTTRLYAGSCLVGSTLWVYGGITGQKALEYLNDCWTFSLGESKWKKVDFTGQELAGKFKPEPLALHSMTAVFSKRVFSVDGGKIDSFVATKWDKLNV